jgi:hypothetical protein
MKKQNQIKGLSILDSENYENIFNVYMDSDDMYFYNLLQTVVFPPNLPPGMFDSYAVGYGDTWPLISYKSYNTPNLWWIILLANEIENPTIQPSPGTFLFIPNEGIVKEILNEIKS